MGRPTMEFIDGQPDPDEIVRREELGFVMAMLPGGRLAWVREEEDDQANDRDDESALAMTAARAG
jgi:hypothetical protein